MEHTDATVMIQSAPKSHSVFFGKSYQPPQDFSVLAKRATVWAFKRGASHASSGQMYTMTYTTYITNLFFIFLQCIVFAPEKIPFGSLGAFGSFCEYLVDNHAGLMYKGYVIRCRCCSAGIRHTLPEEKHGIKSAILDK